jgi:hypothetical protein
MFFMALVSIGRCSLNLNGALYVAAPGPFLPVARGHGAPAFRDHLAFKFNNPWIYCTSSHSTFIALGHPMFVSDDLWLQSMPPPLACAASCHLGSLHAENNRTYSLPETHKGTKRSLNVIATSPCLTASHLNSTISKSIYNAWIFYAAVLFLVGATLDVPRTW